MVCHMQTFFQKTCGNLIILQTSILPSYLAEIKQWIQKLLGPTRAAGDQRALLPWETELEINYLVQEQKRLMDMGFDCIFCHIKGIQCQYESDLTALRSSNSKDD